MAEKNDYVNRELSWIEFNYRVLSEARDKSTPLFDRLKFLALQLLIWMSFTWSV